MSVHSTAGAGAYREFLQPTQLDRLLKGQQRLESVLDEIRRSLNLLTDRHTDPWSPGAKWQPTSFADHSFVPAEVYRASSNATHARNDLSEVTVPLTSVERVLSPPHQDVSLSSLRAISLEEANLETGRQSASRIHNKDRPHSAGAALDAHRVLADLQESMARTNYAHVEELVASQDGQACLHRPASFQSVEAVERSPWHPRMSGFVIHPAARICSVFDAVRACFLVNDLILVPYVLAWDVALEDWLYFIGCIVVTFWTLDLMMNFCTGYIQEGNVIMHWPSIASQYLRRGFVVDFLALLMEAIDLGVTTFHTNGDSRSLQVFKILRFVKVTRLVRIMAKLREGLLARLRAGFSYWMQVYGLASFQMTLDFTAMILKLLFVIAWLGHMGSCFWYGLHRKQITSGDMAWQEDWLDNSDADVYLQGLYWSVSTMFSGASPVVPVRVTEVLLANMWVVMGAMFVTSITSTLAASLIEAHERNQDINKKVHALTTFMAQQKTPVFLSLSVQANFQEKLHAPKLLTELDLPFLKEVAPSLRAALRENQYMASFLHKPSFRMFSTFDHGIIQMLAFEASSVTAVTEGEEVFTAGHEMAHCLLLSRGGMKYDYFSLSTSVAHGRTSADRAAADATGSSQRPSTTTASTAVGILDTMPGMHVSVVSADSWVCELALLLSWTTLGNLVATSACELLLVKTDHFIKVVSSNPATAAVAAEYAVQLQDILQRTGVHRTSTTDLDPGIDHDEVVSMMHLSIRSGLISLPILDSLRKQQRGLSHRLHPWKGLGDLAREVQEGSCHLVAGVESNSFSRVVRVVALRLANRAGYVCMQLGEFDEGQARGKFHLPGCKVLGYEQPGAALKRLIEERLHVLAEGIQILDVETVVEYGSSSSYGLRTKYIRYIHTAELKGDMHKDFTVHGNSALAAHVRSEHSSRVGEPQSTPRHSFRNANSHFSLSRASEASGGRRGHLVATMSWIWPEYMKGGTSDGLATVQSVFSGNPFVTDGSMHAFAVQGVLHQVGRMPSQEPEADARSAVIGMCFSNTFRIYRWMLPSDVDALMPKQDEVEVELTPMVNSLTAEQWNALVSWKLTIDERFHDKIEEEDSVGGKLLFQAAV